MKCRTFPLGKYRVVVRKYLECKKGIRKVKRDIKVYEE
mgnify:CR=1 FL=1